MRALILVAGAALAVSACSSNESADNTANIDDNALVENVDTGNMGMDMNADANMTMDANTTDMNADVNADANVDANNAM